jgi:hypothetical protein
MRIIASVVTLALLLPGSVQAQQRPSTIEPQETSIESSTPMVAAGVVAGVVGIALGAKMGYDLERTSYSCNCDDPGLAGMVAGAFIGPALAIPIAVHVANGGKGKLVPSLLPSLGMGIAGFAFAYGTGGTGILLVPVLPIIEIVTSIKTERRTAKP